MRHGGEDDHGGWDKARGIEVFLHAFARRVLANHVCKISKYVKFSLMRWQKYRNVYKDDN